MNSYYLTLFILSLSSVVFAQAPPTVDTTGFNSADVNLDKPKESWLQQNDRYIFIIVLGLLFVALLTWYLVKSIRGMRKKLAQENQGHMMMIQGSNNSAFSETVPIDNNGFQKMPDYASPHQKQEQYTHRY